MRQVGAFGRLYTESSADQPLKMSYNKGTTFVFGSWICEADEARQLQSCLVNKAELEDIKVDEKEEAQLAEKFEKFSTSTTTRKEAEKDSESDSENEPDYI